MRMRRELSWIRNPRSESCVHCIMSPSKWLTPVCISPAGSPSPGPRARCRNVTSARHSRASVSALSCPTTPSNSLKSSLVSLAKLPPSPFLRARQRPVQSPPASQHRGRHLTQRKPPQERAASHPRVAALPTAARPSPIPPLPPPLLAPPERTCPPAVGWWALRHTCAPFSMLAAHHALSATPLLRAGGCVCVPVIETAAATLGRRCARPT